MKIIPYSLIAIYIAILAAVEAPLASLASETPYVQAAISATGFNEPLLAQAAAASSKSPGVQAPKVNVDQNGVILKGDDPVAYFKQHRAVKGDPTYPSSYGG